MIDCGEGAQIGEGFLYEINYVPLQMTEPQLIYESRRTDRRTLLLKVPFSGFLLG